MDLTHGDVLDGGKELLSNVPMYISADDGYAQWAAACTSSARMAICCALGSIEFVCAMVGSAILSFVK